MKLLFILANDISFGPLNYKKDIEIVEHVQRRTQELGKGLKHRSDEERLPSCCLKPPGGWSQVVFNIFSQVASGTMRGNCLKLCLEGVRFDIRKKFITKGAVKH